MADGGAKSQVEDVLIKGITTPSPLWNPPVVALITMILLFSSRFAHLQISQVQTAADRRYLYFNIQGGPGGRNQTVTVEGGGVNATILQADVAATNGYIHIIDKVLGVPFTTVLQKLKSDSTLR